MFAAPRSFSQRTTSFIASQCQGIHRMPLRRLIALIIDTHGSFAQRKNGNRDLPADFSRRENVLQATQPFVNTIRKTILLHHPSGSCALQDLSCCTRIGLLPIRPSCEDQTKIRPGICLQSQRTKNNRMNVSLPCQTTPDGPSSRSQPPRKNVSSQGQGLDTTQVDFNWVVEPDGIEPTTS